MMTDNEGGILVPPEFQDALKKAYDEHARTGKPFSAIIAPQSWTLPCAPTCGNCGREVEPDWRNCLRCGTDFGEF